MEPQSLLQDIYEVSLQINRPHAVLCLAKVAVFFLTDIVAVAYPDVLDAWPNLQFGLVFAGLGFTLLISLVAIIRSLSTSPILVKVCWRLTAALLFITDYVALPIKTVVMLPLFKTPDYLLLIAALDWLINLILVQFIIIFLRQLRPSADIFFSVVISPVEHALTLLLSVRAVSCYFIGEASQDSMANGIQFSITLAVGCLVLYIMLNQRPFFNKMAEQTFSIGLTINTLYLLGYLALRSTAGALKFMIITCLMAVTAVQFYLRMPMVPKFDLIHQKNYSELKSVLLGLSKEMNQIYARGKLRSYLIKHRKFNFIFAGHSRINFKTAVTFGDNSNSHVAFHNTVTMNKQSDYKDDQKSKKTIPAGINQPNTPSVFSRKGEDEQSKTKDPSVISPTMLSAPLTLHPISDATRKIADLAENSQKSLEKVLDELILDSYLGNNQNGYPAYLYLMWILDQKPCLEKILHLLNCLKKTHSRFRKSLYYYSARREVEKKFLEIISSNKELFKATSKNLNSKKKISIPKKGSKNDKSPKTTTISLEGVDSILGNNEMVDITEAFYLKHELRKLTEDVKSYARLNIEYVESLTMTNQDLFLRTGLVKKMYELDKEIETHFQKLDKISTQQSFQHLMIYFYHTFLNSSKHCTAERVKAEINKRFKSMKAVHLKSIKRVSNLNYLNDCVLLMIESNRRKYGTILDIYGKVEMFLDDPLELIGCSYSIFMNQSLKNFHEQVESMIFEEPMNAQDSYNFIISRPGFIKVPFRSIILPSMIMVRLCPFHRSGFKFVAALKPDFSDDKLYIALNSDLRIDGFSSTFLSILNEEYLRNETGLQNMSVHVHNRITNYHQLDTEYNKNKVVKEKQSKKKISPFKSTFRQQLEGRTANFFIEDAKSARSVLNSAQNSGGRSDIPTNSDMTRDIVLDEKLNFFHVRDDEIEPVIKSFKILLKYHNYPNKILKANQPKGYWYMCLTPTSELGYLLDLPHGMQTDQIDMENSLTYSKGGKDNLPNNPSEGKFKLYRIQHHQNSRKSSSFRKNKRETEKPQKS